MTESLQTVTTWLKADHQPAYRLTQVCQAWYTAAGWEEVTVLPKPLRQQLTAAFNWYSFPASAVRVFSSPRDGTKKAIITLADGQKIETVLMPNVRGSYTVCLSSQVGCGMGCTFCATGTMGLKRNLTADEIVDQMRWWRNQPNIGHITNIVLMGMGEPLANYESVKEAITTLINNCAIGPTRIVLSTVAFPVGLQRLLADKTFPAVRLAISLHAGTNATRAKIVPCHKQTSMKKLVEAVELYLKYHANRRHRVTLEYVMLLNVNDTPAEADALVRHFEHIKTQIKVNLIPWNQTSAKLQSSSTERLYAFKRILERNDIAVMIRYSKGLDIAAACGQLIANGI